MRILLTGGGTGGHILPNIAIIEALNELANQKSSKSYTAKSSPPANPAHNTFAQLEIFYVGEKKSLEERLIGDLGIPFYGIHAGKLRRYFDLKNIVDLFKVPVGIWEAFRVLGSLRPDLVFAKGGYVSVPVCLAARLRGIPVWIHESDVSPGLSTKICARFADKIWLSFKESNPFFSDTKFQPRLNVVGNPVRKNIQQGNKEMGCVLTGFNLKKPILLVIGGSTGAKFLNDFVQKNLKKLLEFTQVVHITGPKKNSSSRQKTVVAKNASYRSFEYLHDDLAHIYQIANVVLTRAGSGSIFELLALHKPMILVPLPLSASRGDQIENAEVFARNGYAISIDQDNMSEQDLLKTIRDLALNSDKRDSMITAQKKAKLSNAAHVIALDMLVYGSSDEAKHS